MPVLSTILHVPDLLMRSRHERSPRGRRSRMCTIRDAMTPEPSSRTCSKCDLTADIADSTALKAPATKRALSSGG